MRDPSAAAVRRALGKAIRRLREHAGISQEQLALESGIGRSYMGRLERGEASPTYVTARKLLRPLGIGFGGLGTELDRQLKK